MENKFAFIHPVCRNSLPGRGRLVRMLPDWLLQGFFHPSALIQICGPPLPFGAASCSLIPVNLTSHQLSSLPAPVVMKKILRSGKIAERQGARIIGLSSKVAAVSKSGSSVFANFKAAVTTGASLHIASMLESSKKILSLSGINLEDAEILILGAAGSVGSICTQILARDGANYLVLISRNRHRLDILAERILREVGVSVKVTSHAQKAAQKADLIMITPEEDATYINLSLIKPGAIICNLQSPWKLPGYLDDNCGGDIFIIEECFFNLLENAGPLKFAPPPALIEAAVLSLERRYENYSLGRDIRLGKIDEIGRLAAKHGFKTEGIISNKGKVKFTEISTPINKSLKWNDKR